MNIIKHKVDEEGRIFFYLNEYETKFYIIRTGHFGKKTLITLSYEEPGCIYDIDFLILDEEKTADLKIDGTGNLSLEMGEWIQNVKEQRYYILGIFSAEKLLNHIEEKIQEFIQQRSIPISLHEDLFQVIHSYMRNPMNHRIGIQ